MNHDQLNCLLAKITSIRDAVLELPSFGTADIPTHPWECIEGVTVGSERWDEDTFYLWKLVETGIASMLVFKFDLGDFDSGDGVADIDIKFYDGGHALLFTILAGDNIQSALETNLDDILGTNTMVHRATSSGSYTYYARQKNDGSTQTGPISGGDIIVSIEDSGGGIIVTPESVDGGECQWILSAWANH